MSKPLYNALQKYKSLKRTSFHTPGHKGKSIKNSDYYNLDYTELPFTDNLYESKGIIKQAEDKLADLYGSKKSVFSCGGNTLCIQAMIRLSVPSGSKILCDRVVHRSAVSTFGLLGIEVEWLERKIDEQSRLAQRISAKDVDKKLKEDSKIRAVYLTSPDYYGIMQDIKSISEICKKRKVALIVDNAHGSHLKFLERGLHPLEQGATMSADSAHKTLPVITGGAWLHINDEKYCAEVKKAMALFGSTSPSYPVMASMDVCREWLEIGGDRSYRNLLELVAEVKDLARTAGIYVPDDDISDPCRITLGVWKIGFKGEEFRDFMYKFKVEPEFCDKNYVVLIPTPFNDHVDWSRLKMILRKAKKLARNETEHRVKALKLPEKSMSVREALMSRSKNCKVNETVGKIAAEIVCPCPPGVPVVMPGELIAESERDALINYGISEINVVE